MPRGQGERKRKTAPVAVYGKEKIPCVKNQDLKARLRSKKITKKKKQVRTRRLKKEVG